MRVKISITLPRDLLKASRACLARLEKAKRAAKDAETINRNADRLNEEARDVLGYQCLP